MDAVAASKEKAAARVLLLADEEADAQTLRAQGIMLPDKLEGEGGGATNKIAYDGGGAVGAITLTEIDDDEGPSCSTSSLSTRTPGETYEERDYTHWAKNRLVELVREGGDEHCAHRWYAPSSGGASSSYQPPVEAGSVRLTRLLEDRFDGHALVKTKAGRRALYYELDVACEWVGRHEAKGSTLKGIIRVYNVAQDTQFCPGGDTGTSYMYETARENAPSIDGSAAWVAEVMEQTGELFEVLSGRVGALLHELTLK